MDSLLWKSFAQSETISVSRQLQNGGSTSATSSLQTLLIILACSHLRDLAIRARIYPDLGTPLGAGATFFVERKQAQGKMFVAVKHIIQDEYPSAGSLSHPPVTKYRLDSVLLEVQALLHYPVQKHPNIVELLAYGWDDGGLPYLVVEYADLGSLDSYLHLHATSWEQKLKLALDAASGLELLHACDIIHGDIKLENVLVFSSEDGSVLGKISDFGFCCSEALVNNTYHGTRVLNAPEILDYFRNSSPIPVLDYMACDTFSYGLLLWEVFNGGNRFYTISSIGVGVSDTDQAIQFRQQLIGNSQELHQFAKQFFEELPMPHSIRDQLESVMLVTLSRDPQQRSTMEEVRLQLDPNNEREIEMGYPLRLSHYSIFDVMTAPLTWAARVQLVEEYRAGACDANGVLTGHNAFNLAACYALGFGVRLSVDEAYHYLEVAAARMYGPARVLWTAYKHNGLVRDTRHVSSSNDDFGQYLEALESGLLQLPPLLRFTARMRTYYRDQFAQMSSCHMTVVELGVTFQTLEAIKEMLLAEADTLHELTATLDFNKKSIVTLLLPHLVSSHEEFAEVLLRKGAIAGTLDDDNVSLLNIACAAGSLRIVRVLLELFPHLARQPSKDGISPLHWLFMFSDAEIPLVAKSLVEQKASFLSNGVTELADFNLVLSGLPLHWAVMTRSASAVRALIELGANVNETSFALLDHLQYPEYAVDLAVCLHMPEMVQLLLESGASINDRPQNSVPPALHYIGDAIDPFRIWLIHGESYKEAAQQTMKVLLDAGAGVNARSSDGLTTLQHAASRANYQTYVVEMILSLSPSVTTGDNPFRSPIHFASTALQHDRVNSETIKLLLNYSHQHLDLEEFMAACRETLKICTQDGTLGAASEILAALGTDSKTVVEEEQLMHLAAEHDQPDILKLYLDIGADINLDQEGTPAACAAAKGKKAALKFLLSEGASVLSMPGRELDCTIMHEIVGPLMSPGQSFSTLEFVHENFRDLLVPFVNNYDMFGFTALHEAIIWGNIKNVAFLLERFMAHPRNVEHTGISPTTLAVLLKAHPPWYYTEQGTKALFEYQSTLDAIMIYLCETCELQPPDLKATAAGVFQYWTRPDHQLWADGDSTAQWRMRIG